MRVFIFEYVTGGGYAGSSMVPSLAAEGDLMLGAVVRDLLQVDEVEVCVCRDRRLELPGLPIDVDWVDLDWRASWARCLHDADAVLPIAPETNGVLEYLCREVEIAGKVLLNSSSAAVAVATCKQETLDRLATAGVPVVPSWRADRLPPMDLRTLVVKPDDGVGCQGIRLISSERALSDFLGGQERLSDWLVQPYVEGQSASLSLLVGADCVCVLGSNRQRVAQVDDGFMLLGCVVNGLMDLSVALLPLARRVCGAIPGLWGYVGIDFIQTPSGPVVLEVNPRLTTSYAGLSQSIGTNVAELMLRLVDDPGMLPRQYLPGRSVHVDLELGRVA